MNAKLIALAAIGLLMSVAARGQVTSEDVDSLYLVEVQDAREPDKVLHAEPLYIDLIRDLGARRGEKEWNVGVGLTDMLVVDKYELLVEYEWAPVDRLGLEVELPFTLYARQEEGDPSGPASRLNGLKTAVQWTFLVRQDWSTSMAIGYINEVLVSDFRNFGRPLITGNLYNPFLVVARRWGAQYHTLIYTGPVWRHAYETGEWTFRYEVNTNLHYMISGTRNFLGVECNQQISDQGFDMTIRPQMRLGIADDLLVGIVAGIPVSRAEERFSTFMRLIWEPGHRHRHKP